MEINEKNFADIESVAIEGIVGNIVKVKYELKDGVTKCRITSTDGRYAIVRNGEASLREGDEYSEVTGKIEALIRAVRDN